MTVGTEYVYPATLPTPQAASIQSVERRVLSSEGFFESRAGQTDRLSIEEITFPPLTPAEALIFDAWWRDDLLEGGIWFAAAWPRPEGQTSVARRFLRPPSWDYIGAPDSGYWRVTATFEVRGTGELPVPRAELILGMHFDGDAVDEAGLSTFSGSIAYVDGKFDQGFDGSSKVIYSAGLPVLNLGTQWRVEGWFRLDAISDLTFPAYILTMGHAGTGMGAGGPGGNTRQMLVFVQVEDPVDGGILRVSTNDQTGVGENTLTSSDIGVSSIFGGVLYWFCAGSDGTNMRLYLGADGDTNAVLVDEMLNETTYAGADFTNQCFVIGAGYAGGGWPGIHTSYVNGMLDDIVIYSGPNAMAERVGATIPMPTIPFWG
jgi:hypothetical protein